MLEDEEEKKWFERKERKRIGLALWDPLRMFL